jgi:hypothetical protein
VGVEVHRPHDRLVHDHGQGKSAADAVLGSSPAEGGPRAILPSRLDTEDPLLIEGVEAGSLAGVVLGLVDLGRQGIGEHRGAAMPVDEHRDAGQIGAGYRFDGQVGHPLEGVLHGTVAHQEAGQSGEGLAQG